MKSASIIALLLVVLIWGSSFTVIKLGAEEIPPITLAFLRFAFALPFLLTLTYLQDRRTLRSQVFEDWKIFSILGLAGPALHNILQNLGLQYTSASNASLIIASNPIFITLLDRLYLKEKVTLRLVSGIALAFCGIIVVIRPEEWSLHPLVVFGDLLCLGSAIFWAFYSVYSRKAMSKYGANEVMTFSVFFGVFFLLPIAFTFEKPVLPASTWVWFLLLFLSLVCSGLAYLLWGKVLKDVPATKAGVFLFLIPIVSVVIAHFVLSETLDSIFIIGAFLVLVGVAITEIL